MTESGDVLSDQGSAVPDVSWKAVARATYDQAIDVMQNPPTMGTMKDLFDHRLGTYGQAYVTQDYAEVYAENDLLRAENEALKAAIREHRTGVLHGERGLEASDYDEALWRSVETDEQEATDCARLLVGQGTDTWDPICARPRGHEGPCRPGADGASRDSHPTPEEGR